MRSSFVVLALFVLASTLLGQTGSINNTLGSGGTFSVKNSASNPLVTVDETTGQLTADRIKVEGVPSFAASHIAESDIAGGDTLLTWDEASKYGSHDNSNSFNPSTGEFTAPRNGFYFISAGIELAANASTASLNVYANSSSTVLVARVSVVTTAAENLATSGVLKLNAGDVLRLRLFFSGLTSPASTSEGWFSGYLVSDF